MRVLLVDDEEELVSTLAERLNMRGIEADWATKVEDAISLVGETSYDIAVLDIKLPKMSGLQLKKKLEDLRPKMKFIFMTGHGSEADFRTGAAEAGEAFYLVKPVGIEILVEKMQEVMQSEGKRS
ncbi:Response regulator receiver protein [uncultured Desulfatiglans sp.]|uniref:Response regulator receiver protein n=1 Tax=Uncultured Desulfatiglans sp. TaxID=1748965 RepID=A0A653A0C5_UNCDX|nr:Response regulator receiver protein [uncultured Desulfatiglans sp.]